MEQREVVATVFSGAWHALKSYELGNSAPDLAAEMARAIEGAARMLGVTIEGISLARDAESFEKSLETLFGRESDLTDEELDEELGGWINDV